MKRKLILTITIAALLCILFAFTVSAVNYFDLSNACFDGIEGMANIYIYQDEIFYEGTPVSFGLTYFTGTNGITNYGFLNVQFWDHIMYKYNVENVEGFVSAFEQFNSLYPLSNMFYMELIYSSESVYSSYLTYRSANNDYSQGYDKGYDEGLSTGYVDGYETGVTDSFNVAADYIEEWFTLQGIEQYITTDETLPSKDIFMYEFNHNAVAFREATYSKGETDGLNASGIAKEGILSIISAPFYFLSGVFNFEIFGINLFSIISVILTLAVVGYFFKKIKG